MQSNAEEGINSTDKIWPYSSDLMLIKDFSLMPLDTSVKNTGRQKWIQSEVATNYRPICMHGGESSMSQTIDLLQVYTNYRVKLHSL